MPTGQKNLQKTHRADSPENAHGMESLGNARKEESSENACGVESSRSRILAGQRVQRKGHHAAESVENAHKGEIPEKTNGQRFQRRPMAERTVGACKLE